ncbi:helix-turn-helix domain-containing protein [Pectobacterium carotovorum]|uniref:helix-turn-helix domain-containing protein n=1 Tax=Pectobacterium carotovorum TaxID=554 RepID=UPI0029D5A45B|nr:helix-turn-helix domain-containing protein [Pectobacterium carotovorum]MDX6916529.1 helix-turn-helix domain-containing protein [Pectobacterium carotovorum]
MRTDNQEHKTLFTIPSQSHGTEMATTKPLPPQRAITGHKQTDAYLWVLEVIKLNEPAHLPAAEEALKKLKITPKDAQRHYSDYLIKSGADPMQAALGTFLMDNPQGYINRARQGISKASEVRAVFGDYETALEDTEAEKRMLSGEMADVYSTCWGWTEKEIKDKCMYGKRVFEVAEQRYAMSKGFRGQLPEPETLSDVVREFQYWGWLYWMRDSAAKELGYEYGDSDRDHIGDREDYLRERLATIKPVSRCEAVDVCRWVLENESLNDLGEKTDNIILNLVGECG